MIAKLKLEARRIAASYLRALAAVLGATQVLNIWDARGWIGALQSAAVAAFPAVVRAIEAVARKIEE